MMENIWFRASEVEPEDGQLCHILGRGGWGCATMITGITYKKGHGWLDIFASPEAGAIYSREAVLAWTPAEKIPMPPEDWE